jgi:hypothetical protein
VHSRPSSTRKRNGWRATRLSCCASIRYTEVSFDKSSEDKRVNIPGPLLFGELIFKGRIEVISDGGVNHSRQSPPIKRGTGSVLIFQPWLLYLQLLFSCSMQRQGGFMR